MKNEKVLCSACKKPRPSCREVFIGEKRMVLCAECQKIELELMVKRRGINAVPEIPLPK